MATEINKFFQLSHSTGLQAEQNKPIQSSKKVAPEQNEETNKAIKYMIGATAIASIIAFGVLSKKGKLGENVKNALWGTSKPNTVKPNVSSTINDILTPDQKAKSTLANLYQKVIDNANKSGNNRRAGIFEQCKNNIDTLDTKTVYGNLLDALYKDLRLGEYSTSNLITKDIDKITAQSSSLIKVKNAHGWHYRSPFIENMVNGPFEKPFLKEGIVNSWLTTDKFVVEEYNKDPLCGVPFTLNGYYCLFSLMEQVYSKLGWTNKNKQLPVMFMSGGDDPCRKSDKDFKKAVTHFKHCGFPNTFSKLYPGMRHELFNELNNEEVYYDILKFLEIKVGIEPLEIDED